MSKSLFRSLAVLGLSAAMVTGTAWAQGRGHARGNASNQVWAADRDGDHDWRGDRDRWTFGDRSRPSGWEKGKKTGWGDCDVPPGQAKKAGCAPSSRVFSRGRGDDHRNEWRRREQDRRQSRHDRDRDRR